MKEDKEEIGKYILNLLQDIKGLRTENKKLKKENYLNSQVETTFKSDLAETLEEYREKIIKLETRNRELEGKLKGSRTNWLNQYTLSVIANYAIFLMQISDLLLPKYSSISFSDIDSTCYYPQIKC